MALPPTNGTKRVSPLGVPETLLSLPVVRFQPPPGADLNTYDRTRRPADQPSDAGIPPTFIDAMRVRERVFVQEQNIPMIYEFDPDDARCAHWVLYSPPDPEPLPEDRSSPIPIPGAAADGNDYINPHPPIPVGTIRLVPFPHPPHPEDGGVYVDGNLLSILGEDATFHRQPAADRATTHHDGREPYLKLGRLAVVPSHRNRRLAGVLIEEALSWAVRNPGFFNFEREEDGEELVWKGLVLVHAQKTAVRVWQYHGFIEDEGMGTWWEEGIEHVGMFRRVGGTEAMAGATSSRTTVSEG